MTDFSKLFYSCQEVSAVCPVEGTVLGYYPNLGANITLAIGFGVCALATAGFGIWKKTWGYTLAVACGCLLEFVGYVGRIILHQNPWNSTAFQMQMIAIILAPTVLCISIYLTLEHVCLSINPLISRIKPKMYLMIFLPLDLGCLALQAIGGGLAAASAQTDQMSLLPHGNRTIIAGITLQVLMLSSFGILCADYLRRAYRYVHTGSPSTGRRTLWNSKRFRLFGGAVSVAYAGILIRCIYRIIEMAGGWGNHIMRDEISFIVLEGFAILIPAISLAAFPPGVLFPEMAARFSGNVGSRWRRFRARREESRTSTHGSSSGEGHKEPVEENEVTPKNEQVID